VNAPVNRDELSYYVPDVSSGAVINVYDGDTITIGAYCDSDKNKQLFKFRVRLANIDCPELRTTNEEEKEIAIIAREKLKEKIQFSENKTSRVYLKNVKLDKYGRLLADVWYNNICINDWLLEERLAVKYDGKSKEKFLPTSWKKYYLEGTLT
jgi:endonuclease YncB( thermonuclease family)